MPTPSRLLLTLALVVGLTACDSTEGAPSIGGTYRASVTVDDADFGTVAVAFRMTIPATTGGPFRFTGEVTADGDYADDFDGAGTYAYPSITLAESGDSNDVLSGTVSSDGNRLTFADAGLAQPLVFTR